MPTSSRWRAESRRVIREVLAGLPRDATRRECTRALRAAYPFGSRKHHPYRCWCAEQRRALEERFGAWGETRQGGTRVAFVLGRRPREGRLWLDVRCDWCHRTLRRSCLFCGAARDRLAQIVADPTFRALRTDPAAEGVLRDWLAEQGISVEREP